MTKDELKNKISMALKDPMLQQGFEIICKEIAELRKHKHECETSLCRAEYQWMYEKFEKAKEIIKRFSEFANNEIDYDPEHPQEYTDLWHKLCEEAEQFLKEIEE